MATPEEELTERPSTVKDPLAGTGDIKPAPAPTPAPEHAPAMDGTGPKLGRAGEARPLSETGQVQPKITPVTTEVDQPTGTVAGQMTSLLGKDSAYIDQARRDAVRSANTRGLINTSIAAGAGTEAAVRAAMPIAQQDATTYDTTRKANQAARNEFLKNEQSANLNKEMESFTASLDKEKEAFSTQLQQDMDLFMNDAKFSDEVKLQYVGSINNIMRDSQQQITDIGLSDRKAGAQAAAIEMVIKNRDAELAVYQDLLGGFNDWDWGTDFTPESAQPELKAIPVEAVPTGTDGSYELNGVIYNNDGSRSSSPFTQATFRAVTG